MSSPVAADQLAKSLSFEVEATPTEGTLLLRNANNLTPLNVKVRVRKKGHGKEAVIAMPQPDGHAERLRLASSDQTIMSFNVLMEVDFERKPRRRRAKRRLLGLCISPQSEEDEDQYRPPSPERGDISKSESGASKNKAKMDTMQIETTRTAKNLRKKDKMLFGKCKPGGCLDPPFGEDRYAYRPSPRRPNAPVPNIDDLSTVNNPNPAPVTTETNKNLKKKKDAPIESWAKSNEDDSSVLSLYHGKPNVMEEKESDSIITYPPAFSPSGLLYDEEKKDKSKRPSLSRQSRKSFNEFDTIYYSPANRTPRNSKDNKKFSLQSFTPTIAAIGVISPNKTQCSNVPQEDSFDPKKALRTTSDIDDNLEDRSFTSIIVPTNVLSPNEPQSNVPLEEYCNPNKAYICTDSNNKVGNHTVKPDQLEAIHAGFVSKSEKYKTPEVISEIRHMVELTDDEKCTVPPTESVNIVQNPPQSPDSPSKVPIKIPGIDKLAVILNPEDTKEEQDKGKVNERIPEDAKELNIKSPILSDQCSEDPEEYQTLLTSDEKLTETQQPTFDKKLSDFLQKPKIHTLSSKNDDDRLYPIPSVEDSSLLPESILLDVTPKIITPLNDEESRPSKPGNKIKIQGTPSHKTVDGLSVEQEPSPVTLDAEEPVLASFGKKKTTPEEINILQALKRESLSIDSSRKRISQLSIKGPIPIRDQRAPYVTGDVEELDNTNKKNSFFLTDQTQSQPQSELTNILATPNQQNEILIKNVKDPKTVTDSISILNYQTKLLQDTKQSGYSKTSRNSEALRQDSLDIKVTKSDYENQTEYEIGIHPLGDEGVPDDFSFDLNISEISKSSTTSRTEHTKANTDAGSSPKDSKTNNQKSLSRSPVTGIDILPDEVIEKASRKLNEISDSKHNVISKESPDDIAKGAGTDKPMGDVDFEIIIGSDGFAKENISASKPKEPIVSGPLTPGEFKPTESIDSEPEITQISSGLMLKQSVGSGRDPAILSSNVKPIVSEPDLDQISSGSMPKSSKPETAQLSTDFRPKQSIASMPEVNEIYYELKPKESLTSETFAAELSSGHDGAEISSGLKRKNSIAGGSDDAQTASNFEQIKSISSKVDTAPISPELKLIESAASGPDEVEKFLVASGKDSAEISSGLKQKGSVVSRPDVTQMSSDFEPIKSIVNELDVGSKSSGLKIIESNVSKRDTSEIPLELKPIESNRVMLPKESVASGQELSSGWKSMKSVASEIDTAPTTLRLKLVESIASELNSAKVHSGLKPMESIDNGTDSAPITQGLKPTESVPIETNAAQLSTVLKPIESIAIGTDSAQIIPRLTSSKGKLAPSTINNILPDAYSKDKKIGKIEFKDSIFLDLAFQTHLEENQMVVKTLDSTTACLDKDNVVLVKSLVKPPAQTITVPINNTHVMNIMVKSLAANTTEPNIKPPRSIAKFDSATAHGSVSGISYRGRNLISTISSIYGKDLVPLQQEIVNLRNDIDELSTRQMVLKDLLGPKRLRHTSTTHSFNMRRCSCMRK